MGATVEETVDLVIALRNKDGKVTDDELLSRLQAYARYHNVDVSSLQKVVGNVVLSGLSNKEMRHCALFSSAIATSARRKACSLLANRHAPDGAAPHHGRALLLGGLGRISSGQRRRSRSCMQIFSYGCWLCPCLHPVTDVALRSLASRRMGCKNTPPNPTRAKNRAVPRMSLCCSSHSRN